MRLGAKAYVFIGINCPQSFSAVIFQLYVTVKYTLPGLHVHICLTNRIMVKKSEPEKSDITALRPRTI